MQSLNVPQRFAALEGWRGLSALLVAVLHLPTAGYLYGLPIVANAYLLVDLFFVLSGFVITHAYLGRLATIADVRTMIWRRLARLWPLHVALLAAFIGLELGVGAVAALTGVARGGTAFGAASGALPEAIPTHLLLLHAFGLHDRLSWNMPSWSIAAEFWTYVVFALVALFAGRISALVAIVLAVTGAAVIAVKSRTYMAVHFDLGFLRCLYGFFVGHLVYRLTASWSIDRGLSSALEIACLVQVIAFVSAAGRTPFELAAPLVFGVVVLVFARGQGIVSDILASRPLVALGTWSYSIYMVHALLVALLHRGLTVIGGQLGQPLVTVSETTAGMVHRVDFGGSLAMDLLTLGYLGVVVAISALTWRYIEMPAQRRMNGVAARPVPPGLLPELAGAGAGRSRAGAAPINDDTSIAGDKKSTAWSLGVGLPGGRYFMSIRFGAERRDQARLNAEGQIPVHSGTAASVVAAAALFLLIGMLSTLYLLKSYAGIDLFPGASPLHPLYALFFE